MSIPMDVLSGPGAQHGRPLHRMNLEQIVAVVQPLRAIPFDTGLRAGNFDGRPYDVYRP